MRRIADDARPRPSGLGVGPEDRSWHHRTRPALGIGRPRLDLGYIGRWIRDLGVERGVHLSPSETITDPPNDRVAFALALLGRQWWWMRRLSVTFGELGDGFRIAQQSELDLRRSVGAPRASTHDQVFNLQCQDRSFDGALRGGGERRCA